MTRSAGRILILLLILSSLLSEAFGQNDFESKYLLGKDLYGKGRYTAAMEILKPVTSAQEGNKFAAHAQYFYALSALKAGMFNDAKSMLLQLTNNYPEWEEADETYYLLGNVSFEQGKYRMGLKYLQDRKKDMKDDIERMKAFYADKITPIDTLINLQKDFPTDPVLAKALFNKLNYMPGLSEKQKMLMEYLAQEFRLEKKKAGTEKQSEMKPSYNVALLFPFLLKEFNTSAANRPNQYVFDLYEGIKLSADSLKKAGINVNLYAYDTEKSDAKVQEILNLPELKSMDVIIGPVFPAHAPLVNDFGAQNKILVINPISTNPALTEGNPFVYLFQPMLYNFAATASNYAVKNFVKDETVKQVLILQSPTTKDSLLCNSYRDSIRSKGFEVKYHEVITKDNMKRVQEVLKDSLLLTTVSHIFISTYDQVLAANIISALEISGFKIPLFTSSEWLHFPLLTYDQYERREVHFLFPDYINYHKDAVHSFRRKFYARVNSLPLTSHAYQGYDLVRWLGRSLSKYGNYPVLGWKKEGFTPGYILTGFNYSIGQSNTYIPIVRFKESELQLLNYPGK